jgi:malate dehydrogenase (quinone)
MNEKNYDLVLIGAGIMSATLATMIMETRPTLKLLIIEKLDKPAMESSSALNNAGTGHAGLCELNYTKVVNDVVDISKAINVNKQFNQSKQFWSYLVEKNVIKNTFIHNIPHISFVSGSESVQNLAKRWEALKSNENFDNMEFTKDSNILKKWIPLIMSGRSLNEPIAATKVDNGTDVDFGNLTNQLIDYLSKSVEIVFNKTVLDITKKSDSWSIDIGDRTVLTKNVFVGAGGAALTLLQKSNIPEINGYGGFPVSGKWLICKNKDIINKHNAKVYGESSVGTPPMSVPHLDTRIINGEKVLLFGPYAGFSTKFLKYGKKSDLFKSLNLNNIGTMLSAGANNIDLTKYLIGEILKDKQKRFDKLKEYYPEANINDWEDSIAGQRVQVIKNENGHAIIEFGTEIIASSDGTMIGLLGASPGASTSVSIMLNVIDKMFGDSTEISKILFGQNKKSEKILNLL